MRKGQWKGQRKGQRIIKGVFNPDDVQRVEHNKLGVWDYYVENTADFKKVPGALRLQQLNEIRQCLPFLVRMLKDLAYLANCWWPLVFYVTSMLSLNVLPAITLWYTGQLLRIVDSAVESRSVDKALLIRVATARAIVAILKRLLEHVKRRASRLLDKRIQTYYSGHIFDAYARLDIPTFDDPFVQRQLDSVTEGRQSVAWDMVQTLSNVASTAVLLISQVSVLYKLLWDQSGNLVVALLSFFSAFVDWFRLTRYSGIRGIWAATCRDEDYLKLQGLKHMVSDPSYRKEIIAGNFYDRLKKDFQRAQERVGDRGGSFRELLRDDQLRDRLFSFSLMSEPMRELPQIFFTLRAVKHPASIPVSLASLALIQTTITTFSFNLFDFYNKFGSISDQLESIRRLYQITHIKNRIVDGVMPYPEDQQRLQFGVSIEFRNVSFRYPGSELYALRNVSFRIERGQLCVIVGTNGSGKSTILKLITRLYDPTEGQILIDDHDIKALKLRDLRKAMSVLFQDYTHFPLCIGDNIGLGDPGNPFDEDRIEQAAKEGGAYEFVNELPDKFKTYLEKPVHDVYSALPEGTTTLFGRRVDHNRVREAGRLGEVETSQLSGGQMQRLAVSRTFMRSIGAASEVGLLLFDEPSASLDPQAEHDLFERLRALRGSKTMIFSSHRFGSLTRHADVILYMKDALIEEIGDHETLLRKGGGYASIYSLQASAFMP